jgi:hypothetical protein
MPRYGINVQYAPSPWEKVMPAIGSAIDQYQRKQDADRTEENQIAAQGGTPIGAPEPSRLDRVRQFLRKKVLGGTDPGAPAAPAPVQSGVADTPVTTQVPAVQGFTAPGGSSLLGGATPTPPAAPPRRIGDALVYDPSTVGAPDPRSSSFFGGGTPATTASPAANPAPVVRSGPGNAPTPPVAAASPASGSIGDALKPYTYTAGSGQKYAIDPMRASNMARAAKRGEAQDEIDIKSADRDKSQRDQIQALVDAGMSPAVARAKVLNNVVKYDETYGQQHPGVMTQKDRLLVQDRIDARQKDAQKAALRLEALRQQGRTGTREFQQLSIQLRAQQQDDANDRAILAADEAEAGRAERAVTTLQTNPVVSATPEGQKAITAAQTAAEAARTKAAESRGRVAGKGGRAAPGAKPTITQSQYDAARAKINPATKQPYTDAEIEQYYSIHPTVKRK